ncbi:MAG: PKD domain-containing protein [Ferruginibacter sp.]
MKKLFRLRILTVLFVLFVNAGVNAQQTLTSVGGWNAYVHLPSTYSSNPTGYYPTIIFFPGIGEVGTNAGLVITHGPGAYIAQGWNGNVQVDGSTVEFIVISLQTPGWPSEFQMNEKIQLLKATYRIDPNKLYLTGLSHGGWCSATFVSGDNYGGPYNYASQVAAVVTVEGVQPADNQPYPNMMDNFALAGGRYLGFEQVNDFRDTRTVVDRMNFTKPGSAIYVQTNFGGGGHCCWSNFYGGQGTQPTNFLLDGISQNIYQWMARQRRNGTGPIGNMAPWVNAGNDVSITLPVNSVSLTGTATDPDGTIASYQWTKVSGPAGETIVNPSAASTLISGLLQGNYQFQLKVTDNAGATATDLINVTVNAAVNQPPVARAGNDQSITLPVNSALIDASGSYDPDGTIISAHWVLVSGPAAVTFDNDWQQRTNVYFSSAGQYKIELTVWDNNTVPAKDTLMVTVNSSSQGSLNQAPVANAGTDRSITLPVNQVQVNGAASYDPDGAISTYMWKVLAGPAAVTIDNQWLAITNMHFSAAGQYTVELTVWDNNNTPAKDTLIITVNPALSANLPPVAVAGADQSVTMPVNYVTVDGGASYDPDGTISSRRWSVVSGPGTATIDLEWQNRTNISFSTPGQYKVVLNVWDNLGVNGSDTLVVTVNNNNQNQAPVAIAGADQSVTMPVNYVTVDGGASYDPDGTISARRWSVVSGPGTATIDLEWHNRTNISFSAPGQYKVVLNVWDLPGLNGNDTLIVTVNSLAVNMAPTANAGADQNITLPVSSIALNGSGVDTDGTITSYLWTKISGPAAGTIVSATSATTSVTGLAQGTYQFQLKVTDNAGATATDIMLLTVNAAPVANQPPVAMAGADRSINWPTNSIAADGSASYDPDGAVISYNWKFVSGPAAIQIGNEWAAQTNISFSTPGQYRIKLDVGDNQGAIGSDTILVTVNAVTNMPPAANAGADITITLPTSQVNVSGSASTDPDGTITAYQWTKVSGPAGDLIVSPSSVNTRIRSLVRGVYFYQLRVTDNAGASSMDTVRVTVNSATNVAPLANAGNDITIQLPATTATLNGTASSDADGSVVAYLWTPLADLQGVVITSPTNSITSVSFTTPGVYTFGLTVTDNGGSSSSDNVTVTVLAASTADRLVKVNISDGKNTYNNPEWNNWKPTASQYSTAFKYSDGSLSLFSAALSSNARFVDNGFGYASTATMCPPEVLQINSIDAARRTLTISGLSTSAVYNLDFFASRAYSGNRTLVTIGNISDTIDTDYNTTDYVSFFNIRPDASGNVTVVLDNISVYQYLAGFTIKEQLLGGRTINAAPAEGLSSTTELISKITAEKAVEDAVSTELAFPNPFKDRLSVMLGNNVKGNYKLTLSSASGAVLWSKTGNKNSPALYEQLNTASLPAGPYIVQVINKGKTSTYKVVKN